MIIPHHLNCFLTYCGFKRFLSIRLLLGIFLVISSAAAHAQEFESPGIRPYIDAKYIYNASISNNGWSQGFEIAGGIGGNIFDLEAGYTMIDSIPVSRNSDKDFDAFYLAGIARTPRGGQGIATITGKIGVHSWELAMKESGNPAEMVTDGTDLLYGIGLELGYPDGRFRSQIDLTSYKVGDDAIRAYAIGFVILF